MNLVRRISTAALLAGALAAFLGSSPARADDSLYDAFGEKAGLVKITDDFVADLLADPRTSPYFDGVSIKRLKEKLVEQFCVLTGGPCEYTGRTMKRSHEGLNINRAAFNALVEDLQKAMDKNGVPFRSQNKLLAKLAPMYRDIEERN
ncbi:group 1 truncated hemoglobin [Paraburkholderia bryophila]|uniref:group I truncated hemoglobin n=1 Tax=Paraburkholderia bryophila TaxID=420952 RepID=UPI00234A2A0A|nr:group 1 truncated hemoglobin [Paraburkholderia bryophila]WCM23822.1 group 1 truncated hemoglobin [Paraburkholderia bryophila]